MKKLVTKIKNFLFCLRYPFWKSRNVFSGKTLGYSFTWYDDIPRGWQIAFGKQLSKDIKQAGKMTRKRLKKHIKWKDLISFQQIKEKYGELCLYASSSEEIEKVLEKYELLSLGYCINCGKPARYRTKGWIEYYCEDCYIKYAQRVSKLSKKEIDFERDRLTIEDIPEITHYINDKELKVDLKKEYNIDFETLWNL